MFKRIEYLNNIVLRRVLTYIEIYFITFVLGLKIRKTTARILLVVLLFIYCGGCPISLDHAIEIYKLPGA